MVKIVLEHRTKNRDNTRKLVQLIREVRDVARKQNGFIAGETFIDADDPCHVIVISTWKKQEDWTAWDVSPARALTRPKIEELLEIPFNAMILSMPVVWREDQKNVF